MKDALDKIINVGNVLITQKNTIGFKTSDLQCDSSKLLKDDIVICIDHFYGNPGGVEIMVLHAVHGLLFVCDYDAKYLKVIE